MPGAARPPCPLQPNQGDKLTSTPYSHCSSGLPAPLRGSPAAWGERRAPISPSPPLGTAPLHGDGPTARTGGWPGAAALPRPCPAAVSLCPPAHCSLWGAATEMYRNSSVPMSRIQAGPPAVGQQLLPCDPSTSYRWPPPSSSPVRHQAHEGAVPTAQPGLGLAGDTAAAFHQPRTFPFPSPSSGRGCAAPGSPCRSTEVCHRASGSSPSQPGLSLGASPCLLAPGCRAAVPPGCGAADGRGAGGQPTAPRWPEREAAGLRGGEGAGAPGVIYLGLNAGTVC